MKTTLIIEDALLERAAALTGIRKKSMLVHLGLESLIAQESRRRLIGLGRSQSHLRAIPRRRLKSIDPTKLRVAGKVKD